MTIIDKLEKEIKTRIPKPIKPASVFLAAQNVLLPLVKNNSKATEVLSKGNYCGWKGLRRLAKKFIEFEPEMGQALWGAILVKHNESIQARQEPRFSRASDSLWGNVTICRLCWRPAPGDGENSVGPKKLSGLKCLTDSGPVGPACHIHSLKNGNARAAYQRAVRSFNEFQNQLLDIKNKRLKLPRQHWSLLDSPDYPCLVTVSLDYPLVVEYVHTVHKATDWRGLVEALLEMPPEASPEAIKAINEEREKFIAKPNLYRGWLAKAEAWLRAEEVRCHGGKRTGAGRPRKLSSV